jgi:hypothetical protein
LLFAITQSLFEKPQIRNHIHYITIGLADAREKTAQAITGETALFTTLASQHLGSIVMTSKITFSLFSPEHKTDEGRWRSNYAHSYENQPDN